MASKPLVQLSAAMAIVAVSFLAGACASQGEGDGPRRNQDVITAEELAPYSTYTALEAIRRLRPRWLQVRGSSSSSLGPAEPVVVIDGTRFGPASALAGYAVTAIESVRFMSASDATTRYGTDFAGGAIVVTTRRR